MDPNSYLGWDPYETNTLPSPNSQKVSRRVYMRKNIWCYLNFPLACLELGRPLELNFD